MSISPIRRAIVRAAYRRLAAADAAALLAACARDLFLRASATLMYAII
jgi:hypothetical protein